MNLRLLSYFVACVEHRTMHAAAVASFITQPALSKAIQKLEEDVGAQLLERRPRGVVPTPYGDVLFRYAKLIESELRRATAEIDAMRGKAHGTISIGLMPNITYLAGRLVAELEVTHPGLKLKFLAASTVDLLPALSEGEIDIAVALSLQDSLPGLEFESLVSGRTSLVVRRSHPVLQEPAPTLASLLDFQWALGRFPAEHRACINKTYLNAGLVPPVPAVEFSSIAYFSEILRSSDMIGMASHWLIQSETWGRGLVALDMDFGFPMEHLGLVYRDNSRVLPGAEVVRICLKKAIASAFPGAPKTKTDD